MLKGVLLTTLSFTLSSALFAIDNDPIDKSTDTTLILSSDDEVLNMIDSIIAAKFNASFSLDSTYFFKKRSICQNYLACLASLTSVRFCLMPHGCVPPQS